MTCSHKFQLYCAAIIKRSLMLFACRITSAYNHLQASIFQAMETCYERNFCSATLVLGSQLLCLHYETIKTHANGVPATIVFGDVQCGKTIATRASLSLLGIQDSHFLKHIPDMELLNITTKTTLGIVIDDPTNATMTREKIMLNFDGGKIESAGRMFKPHTTFITSVNKPCLESLAKSFRYVANTHTPSFHSFQIPL